MKSLKDRNFYLRRSGSYPSLYERTMVSYEMIRYIYIVKISQFQIPSHPAVRTLYLIERYKGQNLHNNLSHSSSGKATVEKDKLQVLRVFQSVIPCRSFDLELQRLRILWDEE